MFAECRHIMPTGRKCHSPALRGKPFCSQHAKLHFLSPAARRPKEIAFPDIENLPGLEAAVAKALTALSSPLTDTRPQAFFSTAFISLPISPNAQPPRNPLHRLKTVHATRLPR